MKSQFNNIALSHFNALYGFALSLTGNSADAEDLVQETYLRAYQKFDQFAFGTSCKAWLFKIMRNLAIDRIRKKDPLLATGDETCLDEMVCPHINTDHLPCAIDMKMAFAAALAGILLFILIGEDGQIVVDTSVLFTYKNFNNPYAYLDFEQLTAV